MHSGGLQHAALLTLGCDPKRLDSLAVLPRLDPGPEREIVAALDVLRNRGPWDPSPDGEGNRYFEMRSFIEVLVPVVALIIEHVVGLIPLPAPATPSPPDQAVMARLGLPAAVHVTRAGTPTS